MLATSLFVWLPSAFAKGDEDCRKALSDHEKWLKLEAKVHATITARCKQRLRAANLIWANLEKANAAPKLDCARSTVMRGVPLALGATSTGQMKFNGDSRKPSVGALS